ncbi:helix-turn-helix domain-containing protein [Streptomyces phaeochromogenes]|uniref:helix-turn-helix transcriptional regulator n=1 Tax=Streptomyces phaeochromogenes TaxID=1923 RepID=UPI002E2A8586|nr:helix-turn-helix transcriptional regulator [Streptomyces phaeochromogenes]
MDGLFDLNDLTGSAGQPSGGLPEPAERGRLRRRSKLSLHQVADACGVSEATVRAWEQGSSTPRGQNAVTYCHLLTALDGRLTATPVPQPPPAEAPDWAALGALRHELPTHAADEAPCRRCQQPTAQRVGERPQHLGTRCPAPTTPQPAPAAAPPTPPPARTPQQAAAPAARPSLPLPGPRTPHPQAPAQARLVYPPPSRRSTTDGPLTVLEAAPQGLTAHLADGNTRSCTAGDLPALLAWTLRQNLGAAPLRPEALPAGPLLILTPSALDHLGLPAAAPSAPQRHPRSDHPLLRQIRTVGWQSDQDGLGPWTRLHPSAGDPACDSIHLAITGWGALHHDTWNLPTGLDAGQLARLLGQYTSLLRTPLGPPGACGHQLMSDLRPAPHRHTTTRALVASGVRGALTQVVDPAPCEAPPGHHLADGAAQDPPADSDIHWWRPPTEQEAERAYVVCLAVNLLHLAGSNSIRVANGPAHHMSYPEFDRKMPGSWLVDLSAAPHHRLLPPPFAGKGPAWHTTPALSYAADRKAPFRPVEGWLRPDPAVPYLDPWYKRIRLARLAVLERLGITEHMDTPDLLAALRDLPHADTGQRALLHAIHATAEDAFTALAQPPTQPDQLAPASWTTPHLPTWRPDLRAAVAANARANLHRKLALTARDGYFPLAVAGDHVLYATHTPHLSEITEQPNSGYTIGIAPGHVRPIAAHPMDWLTDRCTEGVNAAQLLKDTCPSW